MALKELLSDVKRSVSIYDEPQGGTYGLLAEFAHPGALLSAAKATREAGYRHFDTYTPFPIHGMDKAMGLGSSRVSLHTLLGGISGLALATWLQWWTLEVDYPINISNKPLFAIEPSVPIMFELTILFAALGTAAAMLAMNGLPRFWNPLFGNERFLRATDDAFFLFVAATDPKYAADTEAFLFGLGATHVEAVTEADQLPMAKPDKKKAAALDVAHA